MKKSFWVGFLLVMLALGLVGWTTNKSSGSKQAIVFVTSADDGTAISAVAGLRFIRIQKTTGVSTESIDFTIVSPDIPGTSETFTLQESYEPVELHFRGGVTSVTPDNAGTGVSALVIGSN